MFKEKRSLVRHNSRESSCHKCQQSLNCHGLLKKHKCNIETQAQNQSENTTVGDTANAGDVTEMLLDNSDNVNDGDNSIEVLELEKGMDNMDTAKETTAKIPIEEKKSERVKNSDSNIFAHNQMLRYFQEVDDILASMNSIINA